MREQRVRWLPAVSAAPGRCRERSWPTWMLCSTFTRIGSKLKFEPILLPNGLDTACQSRTGRQVGARTCCERLVCSSEDGGRLLTWSHLLPSLAVADLKIFPDEDAHIGLRDAGAPPRGRALSFHTCGPRQSHFHTCGACDSGGPPLCVSRPRALGSAPSKTMSFGISIMV